jgi:hypothetical protein
MSAVHPLMQQALGAFNSSFVHSSREDRADRYQRILAAVQNDDAFLIAEFSRITDSGMFYSIGLDASEAFHALEKLAAEAPNGPLKRVLGTLHDIGRRMNSAVESEALRRESVELAGRAPRLPR